MADTTQDTLLKAFNEAAGGLTEEFEVLNSAGNELPSSADHSASDTAIENPVTEGMSISSLGNASVAAVTPASSSVSPSSNAAGDAGNSSGGSIGSEALSIATTVLESGLGIVPLVAGLIGLFTGGESNTPAPLVKYAMPEKVQFQAADTPDGISDTDFDQMGMPRDYTGSSGGAPTVSTPAVTTSPTNRNGGNSESSGSAPTSPQIHVNVQTMDAQSFLDHSTEIAQAVRSAMLNLSSINDVVSDL